MRKKNPVPNTAVLLFFAAEASLGLALQLAEGRAAAYLSYTVVVLACLFCALFARKEAAYLFTQLALILTLFADYFLVLARERQQTPAMFFFSAVQILYALRLYAAEQSPARRRVQLYLRAGLSLAALGVTLLVLRQGADTLALLSMFYYANLVLNLALATLAGRGMRLMAAGLLLFLLCDTVIGLSFLGSYLPIAENSLLYDIISPDFNLAWAFYVPSQALLSVSAMPK